MRCHNGDLIQNDPQIANFLAPTHHIKFKHPIRKIFLYCQIAVDSRCVCVYGHKARCHSQGKYNYSTQTGTPTYSYGRNGIHEVGRHIPDSYSMDTTTDNIQIHSLSLPNPQKASSARPRLMALRRVRHFFTPLLRSQNKSTSFLAIGPERTKQATNF